MTEVPQTTEEPKSQEELEAGLISLIGDYYFTRANSNIPNLGKSIPYLVGEGRKQDQWTVTEDTENEGEDRTLGLSTGSIVKRMDIRLSPKKVFLAELDGNQAIRSTSSDDSERQISQGQAFTKAKGIIENILAPAKMRIREDLLVRLGRDLNIVLVRDVMDKLGLQLQTELVDSNLSF